MSEAKVAAPLSKEAKLEIQAFIDHVQEDLDDIEIALEELSPNTEPNFILPSGLTVEEGDFLHSIGVIKIESTPVSYIVKLTGINGDIYFSFLDEIGAALRESKKSNASCDHDAYAIANDPLTEYSTDDGETWKTWSPGAYDKFSEVGQLRVKHICADESYIEWNVKEKQDDEVKLVNPVFYHIPSNEQSKVPLVLASVAFFISLVALGLNLLIK